MQAIAGGTWDKLEQVFEDRVARALAKLGVYTQDDVVKLSQRVETLAQAVNELIKSGERKRTSPRAAKKREATRPAKAPASAPMKSARTRPAAVKARKATKRRTTE